MDTEIAFLLLGPLVARSGASVLPIPPGKQRALLAALLMSANQMVSHDELAEVIWGLRPPPSARVTLRNYVKLLRKALAITGEPRIRTVPDGYLIVVNDGELDVRRFETLQNHARDAAREGAWERAARDLRAALELWRGEPLADVPSDLLSLREVPRLAEMRLQAVEGCIDAELRLGRHGEVIAELRRLTAVHPLRERLHALLMLALYRGGQQGEALAAFQHARRMLVQELGAEPGPELRQLHQQILAADPALAAPAPKLTSAPAGPSPTMEAPQRELLARQSRPVPGDGGMPVAAKAALVPRQLPPAVSCFAGREGELATLTGLLENGSGDGHAVVISAIAGTAGVGKTGLATHWAHQVAHLFPDGQLYVNLRGYDPSTPVSPGDALAGFLRALDVPGRDIPAETGDRATKYRSLLAGRRILVLLDNARDAGQVRPLLPGAAGCLAVVTSRDSLAGLVARDGARRIELDGLPVPDAVSLLRELAGARVDADPGAARALAGLCCGLPLALRLAAELAQARPGVPLADLAAELADQQRRLDLLDAGGDPATAIQAVFSWSDQQLDPADARAFWLLGLHPGPDFDAHVMAALTGTGLREASRRLSRLARAHLLQPAAPGRYGMHDLLRRYAADRAKALGDRAEAREHLQGYPQDTGESEQAVSRLLDYYQHAAATAQALLARQTRTCPPAARAVPLPAVPYLADREQALAWARAERGNLLACLDHATRVGQHARVITLTAGLAGLLCQDGPWAEAITRHDAAVRAARHLGEQHGQAGALTDLGAMRQRTGDFTGAAGALKEALGIYRDLGDRLGQASASASLAVARANGDYPGAAGALKEALGIFRDLGDRRSQGTALGELGIVRRMTGDYPDAAGALGAALSIFCDVGDRGGEVQALNEVGTLHRVRGHLDQAVACHRQALNLARQIGDSWDEARALAGLGRCTLAAGRAADATTSLRQAQEIFRQIGTAEASDISAEISARTQAGPPAETR